MKKLIFLISFCLLSQNCTIANENGGARFSQAPVPLDEYDGNVLRQQNAYSSSIIAKPEDYQELPRSVLRLPNSVQEENASNITPKVPLVPEFQEVKQAVEKKETSVQTVETSSAADVRMTQQAAEKKETASIQAFEPEQHEQVQQVKQAEKVEKFEKNEQVESVQEVVEVQKDEPAREIPDEKSILKQFAPNPVVAPKKEIIPTKFTPSNVEKQITAMEEAEQAKKIAEQKAKEEAERAKKLAEEKAKQEAEQKAKREAEEKARLEAEQKARQAAEKKARQEAQAKEAAKIRAEKEAAEQRAKLEAEAEQVKKIAEEKARLEAEQKAKEEAEQAKKLAEEKAKQEEAERAEQASKIPDEKSILKQFAPNPVVAPKKEIIPTKFTPSNVEKQITAMEEAEQAKKLAEQKAKEEAERAKKLAEEKAKQEAEQKAKREADTQKTENLKVEKQSAERQAAEEKAFEPEKEAVLESEQKTELTPNMILRQYAPKPIVKETSAKKFVPMQMKKLFSASKTKSEPTKQEKETFKATVEQPVKIKLTRIEFPESEVFSQEELQALAAPLLGHSVTIEEIKKVTSDITRCYTLGNYPTSRAYLPPQEIKDGVLKIGLLEGKIGKVNVAGNRWTRTSYFKKRIANKEGEILNIEDLEKDVIRFNNNNTAKVSVSLAAGENTGETDVTLNTIDPFPYRISFMTDNMGRKTIGTGRFGTMFTADGLFRYSDRFDVGGYLGRGNRIGFADYSIPIGNYGTRLGVSAAASNISVVNGPMRQFDVGGTSQVYTAYLTHPIFDSESANIKTYTGVNFRKSTSDIMDFTFYDKNTFSITQGFTAKKDTERGIWYTGHYGTVGIKSFNDDNDFFKYEGNITRLHDFGKGIIGQFRVSGQYSPNDDLPWMEQFQIGGMSTVRGYSEALLLGKSGYFASAELIMPIPLLPKRIGSDRLGYIYPRDMIKGAIFMDNGMIFPYKGGESVDSGDLLMSWGFGLRFNLKEDLAARFYWGYGLHNRYETDYKLGRFHFDITCAPDVGKLVSERKPAKKKDNQSEESEDL